MRLIRAAALSVFGLSVYALTSGLSAAQAPLPQPSGVGGIPQAVRDSLDRTGRARILVELNLITGDPIPEGRLAGVAAIAAQRQQIAAAADRLLARLPRNAHQVARRYETVPYLALDIAPGALRVLEAPDPDVRRVLEDTISRPVLSKSVPLIQADQAWTVGYDGSGQMIVVLDTGVDASHPFLAGKVLEEACYSSTVSGLSESLCPNGADVQIGAGAAAPCSLSECLHGTHVAGIAAGNGDAAGQTFSGVAKGANLMAVQVFSKIIDANSCGGVAPCAGAFSSDIIAGLERAYVLAGPRSIASVNMSLGSGAFSAPCDDQPYKPAIDNLRSIGVASVVASGNDAQGSALASPACVSSAVSVGSVEKDNSVSYFSNVASFMSLVAPGGSINSSVPGGGYEVLSGTSMATPHVSGTWAILRQASPNASVSTILDALQQTGLPITDNRLFFGMGVTVPRVSVFEALASLVTVTHAAPVVTAVSPARVRGGMDVTVSVTGSGFDVFSKLLWNGVAYPAVVTSTSQLHADIPGSAVIVGTAQVAVVNAAPGGGTSAPLSVPVDPPPTLTVSATSVPPSTKVTMTLANGFGGSGDWLSLAATGSPDKTYVTWTYVGGGVTDRTWTVTMPSTAGTYEFRLFLNNGYTRVATSPVVTVDGSINPAPVIQSLSPANSYVGAPGLTLTVNGSGFVASSVIRWNGVDRPTTFVSATQLQAVIASADLAAAGSVSVTVFTPAPGGGTSLPATFTVNPPPVLTVSATTVPAGGSVTATLTYGLGGATDWLAEASTTAPDSSYLQYIYVGSGVTTKTWTVTMPKTAGTYEFRYFLNNGYTRGATSAAVTVQAEPSPSPVATSLSPSAVVAGTGPFTLTVNGSGFVSSSVVRWNGGDRPTTFVSGTQLKASIPGTDVATAGTAQVAVFSPAPGGGTSAPLAFTIGTAPVLTVNATSVTTGASVTVTLTNGLGGGYDWLAFAPTSAANNSYIQYTYVGAGIATRTWTVTAPATTGTYEFRLFLNNGYTRAATSPTVTVVQGTNPLPAVTSLSPARAIAGSAAFTLTVNGAGFVASSVIRWNGADRPTTFVSSTQVKAAIGSAEIATVASVPVTVFSPTPGGGLSGALTFSVVPPPTLTVSATSVAPGASVTVTLSGGLGGSTDWLAFALSSAPNTSYVQYTYVGSGVTTRSWTVTVPSTAGTYEFRLFLNNGYTRAATSPPVVVASQ